MWKYREHGGILWEDRGEGPALVLLHGGERGPEAMKRLGERFVPGRRVLIPHLRPLAGGAPPRGGPGPEDEEQRLAHFLQEEGLRRAAIVGHRTSVSRALSLATRPELSPEAVVLLAPVPHEQEDRAAEHGAGGAKPPWPARMRLRRLAVQGCAVTILTCRDAGQHAHHAQSIRDATRGRIVVLGGSAEGLLEEGMEEVVRATRSALGPG